MFYGDDILDKVEIILRQTKDNIISERIIASFAEGAFLSADPERIVFPGLEIMINQQEVYRDGHFVSLTKREFYTLVL